MVEPEQIYQLYLSMSLRYSLAYLCVSVVSFVVPILLWLFYAYRIRSGYDGLPTTRGGGIYIVTAIMVTLICVVLVVYGLTAAIPPLVTPELWALERAAAMCFVR